MRVHARLSVVLCVAALSACGGATLFSPEGSVIYSIEDGPRDAAVSHCDQTSPPDAGGDGTELDTSCRDREPAE